MIKFCHRIFININFETEHFSDMTITNFIKKSFKNWHAMRHIAGSQHAGGCGPEVGPSTGGEERGDRSAAVVSRPRGGDKGVARGQRVRGGEWAAGGRQWVRGPRGGGGRVGREEATRAAARGEAVRPPLRRRHGRNEGGVTATPTGGDYGNGERGKGRATVVEAAPRGEGGNGDAAVEARWRRRGGGRG